MPKLRSFTAAVREFLRAEEEYQWYRASINAEPVRLRSMISSKIMYALPRIVRSQGLAWNSEWDVTEDVPQDDEHVQPHKRQETVGPQQHGWKAINACGCPKCNKRCGRHWMECLEYQPQL